MKVIINKCWGGFGISDQAFEELIKKGWKVMVLPKGDTLPLREGSLSGYSIWSYDIADKEKIDIYGKYHFVKSMDHDLRINKDLIEVVERLGERSFSRFAMLKVIEIPDGVEFEIEEYDGMESAHEVHRVWS